MAIEVVKAWRRRFWGVAEVAMDPRLILPPFEAEDPAWKLPTESSNFAAWDFIHMAQGHPFASHCANELRHGPPPGLGELRVIQSL